MRVENLMNEVPQRCVHSDTLNDVTRRMWRLGCTILPLCGEDGVLLGQIDALSICQRVCAEGDDARVLRVRDMWVEPACSCSVETDVADVWALMSVARAAQLFVVDELGRLTGVVTQSALVEADRRQVAKVRLRDDGTEGAADEGHADWTLIASQSCLISPTGEMKSIQGNLLRLLLVFLERPGSTLNRTELLQRVCNRRWTSSNRYIDVLVGQLRRKFSDDAGSQRIIRTVYGQGYAGMFQVEPTGMPARSLLRSLDHCNWANRAERGVSLAL